MSRYTGPKLRVTRKLGDLPVFTSKKSTQYTIRLKEKQKLRFNYGLGEKQLMNYIKQAKRIKGATGSIFCSS